MDSVKFRFARNSDISLIMEFIEDLAEYEGVSDKLNVNEETLMDWIFIRNKAEVLFVLADGKEIGFALFFHNFSTFIGQAGLYIEDFYIIPEYRGKGYGKKLFQKIASIAVDRECKKVELSCLNWNTSGAGFYKKMGAVPMDEWTTYRVSAEQLQKLGDEHCIK